MSRRLSLVLVLWNLVNMAGLAAVVVLVSQQASEGSRARATQCRTFPISLKLYTAARHYQLISDRDLATYRAARPRHCPPA